MFVKILFSHDGASAILEPATMFLLGTGLIWLGAFGRKKINKIIRLDI
ncbi:MAG: PEP-CTERM sorting domain-containing protein [Desulfobacterales bacterium]